jgi:hypothetical protein
VSADTRSASGFWHLEKPQPFGGIPLVDPLKTYPANVNVYRYSDMAMPWVSRNLADLASHKMGGFSIFP